MRVIIIGLLLFGMFQQNNNLQESVLIKHSCKIINHGYFSFLIKDNDNFSKIVFSYNINLKENSFSVGFVSRDTLLSSDRINNESIDDFFESDKWNKKIMGTVAEKNFLIFHRDFLIWNNKEKLNFFMKACNKKIN
jgi:hypothetical protein